MAPLVFSITLDNPLTKRVETRFKARRFARQPKLGPS
jgi:hypothetical protein